MLVICPESLYCFPFLFSLIVLILQLIPVVVEVPITVAMRSKACLRLLEAWDREFEHHSRENICMISLCVCVALYLGRGLTTG
jgi:hypothetical protein